MVTTSDGMPTSVTTRPLNMPASAPTASVASVVTKTGSQIDGAWSSIVVVQTDSGYAPNPGHPGMGSIVATFCP